MISIVWSDIEAELLFAPVPERYLAKGAEFEINDKLIRDMDYEPGIIALAGRNLLLIKNQNKIGKKLKNQIMDQ